ncbi:MAG: immunoglobulin-like domain-containing protein [Butyrivibrio sp.]
MIYTSKKKGFLDFLKTGNWKYYTAFFVLFIAIIAVIITISVRSSKHTSDPSETDLADNSNTSETMEEYVSQRGKYKICINTANFQITAYSWNNETEVFKDTPDRYMEAAFLMFEPGSYEADSNVSYKNTWIKNEDNSYYRYVTDLGNGFIFHSASYNTMNDKNSLVVSDYESIGGTSSSPGITLQISDAKWIYENCSLDSIVYVYNDETEEVSTDLIKVIDIPNGITWDPTDTSAGSPWCQSHVEKLTSQPEISVTEGTPDSVILSYAKAYDNNNLDVSANIYITGGYNLNKAGEYSITYNISDIYGNTLRSVSKLTVNVPDETNDTESTDVISSESDSTVNEQTTADTSTTGATESSISEEQSTVIEETTATPSETASAEQTIPETTESPSESEEDVTIEDNNM